MAEKKIEHFKNIIEDYHFPAREKRTTPHRGVVTKSNNDFNQSHWSLAN